MRQPRVPEYRENESISKYLKALVLFLKDFCNEAWTASNSAKKGLEGIRIEYPVTSVNKKTGDVVLTTENVAFLGKNPIERDEDDTTQTWSSIGSGYAIFDKSSPWTSQPSTWGFLINIVRPVEVFQIWNAQSGGATFFRSGNASGWSNGWRRIYDSVHKPKALDIGVYPVGAIYLSTASTSPASLFGGTWEQLKDRFLLAAGSSYAAGSTGGAAAHTLTAEQLPNITGTIVAGAGNAGASAGGYGAFRSASGAMSVSGERQYAGNIAQGAWPSGSAYERFTMSFGGGSSHNNMPPYLAVYAWKRVS